MWMYTEPIRSDELMHFGVKGMRWGRRKGPRQLSPRQQVRRERREASKRYGQFLRDYHADRVPKAKGGFASDADRFRVTVNNNPRLKKDRQIYEERQTKIGIAATGAALTALGGVTLSMINEGRKRR